MRIILFAIIFLSVSVYVSAEDKKSVSPTATTQVRKSPAKDQKDVFAGLKRGERVTIILNNRNTFTGEVKYIIKDKIELDITFDSPTLMGTMSFTRKDIKEIRKLDALDETDKTEIKNTKKAEAKKNKATAVNKTYASEPSAPESSESYSQDESKLLALLDKFPPGKVWNKTRYEEIKAASINIQTSEEKEFLAVYENWNKAIAIKEKTNRKNLLEQFPPGPEWNENKFNELSTKFSRIHVMLTETEQEFINKYPDWVLAKVEAEEEKKKQEEAEKEQSEKPQDQSK
ncbi:MAG: hypothetical protein WC980_06255 [Candidatus Brocadiia bacterium]